MATLLRELASTVIGRHCIDENELRKMRLRFVCIEQFHTHIISQMTSEFLQWIRDCQEQGRGKVAFDTEVWNL